MACPYAFVTLVSSDPYLPGALAQVAALRDVHPLPPQPPELPFQTLCLVTPESLDVSTIKALRKAFDLVVGVEILEQDNPAALKLLGRPDLTTVLTKLHVFRLTQFQKIIFLDADVLPIRPMSHLFSISHEFSAAPDVGWPDIFNSGVLVLSPGEDKFEQLNQLVASKPSWDGGDQGLLNEWRDGDWNRLSFTYNTTPTAAYTYAPAYERYGSQIKAIHFIGPNKPWKDIPYRTPGRQPVPSDSVQTAYDYDSLVNRWFDVYDHHYSAPPVPQSPFEIKRYTPAWELPTEPSNHLPTLGLDELKRLAIQGFNASQEHVHPGEGSYTSMPLQGRVDLMRPRKPDSPKQEHQQITDVKHITDHRPLEVYIQDTDDSDHFPIDNFKYDEALSTPIARRAVLDVADEPRWTTLPTPGPNELPSSPRLRMISLPPTPSLFAPLPTTAPDFYASESEAENNNQSFLLARSDSAHEDRPENKPHQPHHQYHPLHHHHHHAPAHAHEQQQQQPQSSPPQEHQRHDSPPQHEERETPKRPASPPMMPWNPAIEPPPNIQPPSNAFPSDTYFENVWDHTPSRKNDQAQPGPSPPDSGGFFQPPPPPIIPDTLIKQGHYRNVTGDSPEGSHPSPDKKKVKTVFPWEGHPRAPPKRVFPDADAPPPSLFLSPGSQSQTESTTPSTPETTVPTRATHGGGSAAPVSQLSPLYGLPTSFSYTNAWDSIPSIQKYASRLVKPTFPSYMQPLPLPLAPAFEDDAYRKNRKKSWDERAEVSSRDGDDEDNADDDDDKEAVVSTGRKLDENDSDGESAKKRRSRRGSVVTANSLLGINKKQYKTRGVQTTVVEKRSMGVQVDIQVPAPKPKVMEAPASGSGSGSGTTRHVKRGSASSRRHWAPATASTVVAPVMSTSSTSTTDLGSGLPVDTLPDHHHHHKHHQQQHLQHSQQQQQHVAKKKSPSASPTFAPMRPAREFVVAPPPPPPPPSQNAIAKSAVAIPTPPPLPLPPAKPTRSGTSSPSFTRSGGTGTGGSAQTKLAAVQMVRSASVPQTGSSARSVGYPPSAPARPVIAAAAPAPAPAPVASPAPASALAVPPPIPTPPLQPGVTLRPTIRTSNSSTSTIVPAPGVGGGGIRSAPASAVPPGPSLRRGGGIGGEEGSSASRNSPSSIARRTSNDSSLGSPASSFGPVSPPPSVGGDVHGFGSHHHHHHHRGGQWANGGSGHGRGHGATGALLSPMRKGTRVWDPARGVDLFKKGSEEVLARFLKMGAWEEEAR